MDDDLPKRPTRYEVVRIAAPQFILVREGRVVSDKDGRPFVFYDEEHAWNQAMAWSE